jgi:hypothetical protein
MTTTTHWHIGVGHIRNGALFGFLPEAIPESFSSRDWAQACVKGEIHRVQFAQRREGNETQVEIDEPSNRTTVTWTDQFGESRGTVFELVECQLDHSSERVSHV